MNRANYGDLAVASKKKRMPRKIKNLGFQEPRIGRKVRVRRRGKK